MCTVNGCDRKPVSKGMCKAHYQRSRRGMNLEPVRRRDLTPRQVYEHYVVRYERGCWEWLGPKVPYGTINAGGQTMRAHRFAYEEFIGPIPDGMEIRHKCDNPECTRPSHLELGTHAENMADMRNRKRSSHGERNPRAKLAATDVEQIRKLYESGLYCREIAGLFSVDTSTVSRIISGRRRPNG